MSTQSDSMHSALRAELEEAEAALAEVEARERGALAAARRQLARAQAALMRVEARIAPSLAKRDELADELARRKRLTVGPWIVNRKYKWPSGTLYVHGSEPGCWTSVAWLRVMTSGPPRWTVDARGHNIGHDLTEECGRSDLMSPSSDPSADFEKLKQVVADRLERAGLFVIRDEVTDERG